MKINGCAGRITPMPFSTISGASHTPPDHTLLTDKMEQLINWHQQHAPQLHPVERAARLHVDFVGIHPFVDGNGRTSRLLMNLELIKAGFPPCIITVEQRLEYYQALDKAHTTGDYADFLNLVVQAVREAFQPYWFLLGIDDL